MPFLSFRDWPLRARMLVLLLAASSLPIAVAVLVELEGAQALVESDAKQLLDARADQLALELDAFHRVYADLVLDVASLPRVVAYCEASGAERERERASLNAVLAAFEGRSNRFRGIAVFDAEGTISAATEPPLLGRNYAFRSYFQRAVSGSHVISDIYISVPEVHSVPSIAYAAPVRRADGTIGGVVAVFVRATAFWDAVHAGNGRAGEGSFSVVYDSAGIRVAHSFNKGEIFHPGGPLDPATVEELVQERRFGDQTRRLLESPSSMPEEFRLVTAPGSDEMFRGFSPANGQWNRFVMRKLEAVPWTVFFLVPERSLQGPIRSLVRETLLGSAALVLLALAAGLLLSNGIVRSVASLSAAAAAMKSGDLRARVVVPSGAELGTLAAGFNSMADSLAAERERLEERVRERTEALARANEALEQRNQNLNERTQDLARGEAREAALRRASVALAGEGALPRLVREGLREVAPIANAAVMACYRVKNETLVPVAGFACDAEPVLRDTALAGLVNEALETGATVVVDPVPDGAALSFDAALASGKPRSIALVPLVAGARKVGLLAVGGLASPGRDARGLLADLAVPLALAIVRHDLLEESRTFAEDLALRNEELRAQSEELKVQGDALRAQQRELDRFFSVSLDLLCVVDFEGRFKRLNPAWSATLGFTEAELVSAPFMDFVHPGDREATLAEFGKIREGAQTIAFENRYRCKDGSHRWLLWSAAPVSAERVVYAAARDVTARRRAEEKLRVQAEELRAQHKELEAKNVEVQRASQLKTEFLANMSHELRTPLNAVIGFSELLLDDGGALAPAQVRYVEDILSSGRHLLGLINDILDLVKIEAGRTTLDLEPVDPEEAIANAAVLVEPAARKKSLKVERAVRTREPALADRARLKQILLNLLSNAVKFAPEGSSIEVGAEDSGDLVRFWVRDEGPGMDAQLVARLFQPFVQGESPLVKKHQGTGLGLAISKGLVEQHGGAIEVESAIGSGTKFTFTLLKAECFEAAPTPAAVEPESRAMPEGSAGGPPLVLIVTETAAQASVLRSWLVEAGYSAAETASGAQAVAMAERLRPSVILLDLIGESGDGIRVLQQLKAHPPTSRIPVVVASVHDEAKRGVALGAADYLLKPLDRSVLLERIAAIVAPDGAHPLVLAIDDDPSVGALLGPSLERAGYRFLSALTGTEGLELARSRRPDLVIVDLVLPDTTGFEVVSLLASDERTRGIPVFVLTARELTDPERAELRRHVRALAEKGDLTREALLAAVGAATRGPRPGSAPGSNATVLVVDDHDMNRELVRAILERLGYRTLTAPDGVAGVEAARSARPDLVLMDLAMPRKDGFSAARDLKGDPATSGIPIVALTAFAMRSDERRVREAGFDGYLTKPVDQRALGRTIAALLRRP